MKTRSFFYLVFSILVLSFASCSDEDKDNSIKQDELPEKVQTFLNEYLPNNKFISAHIEGYGASFYTVQLDKDIEVVFSLDGTWLYMQSQNGLPENAKALLSENSQKELNEKYSNNKVIGISDIGNGEHYIMLNNKREFRDIEAHEGYVLAEKLTGEEQYLLPDKIKKFISQNFAEIYQTSTSFNILKFSGFRGDIYRLLLGNQAFVDFYKDGEWFYMKELGDKRLLSTTLIGEIPKDILKALVEKDPTAISTLTSITRFNNYKLYGFEFGNKKFAVVDSDNKIIEPPLDKAKEYITKVFDPKSELQYEVRSNTSSPYFLRYAFIVTGQERISLVTDIDGNMRNIGAGPITNEPGKSVALPKAALDMLPKAITTYLDTTYPEKDIIQITHSYSVKQDDIPEEINLIMAIPNNLKVLIFKSDTGEFIKDYTVIQE